MLDSHLVTWGVVCLSAGKGHMGRGAQLQVRSVVNKSKLKKKKKSLGMQTGLAWKPYEVELSGRL